MADTVIQPIVEGHGEVVALPVLLRKLWYELGGVGAVEILKPIRQPRSKLAIESELSRFVEFAARKLLARGTRAQPLILLVLDSDDDLPCELGPRLLAAATHARADMDIACVVANQEYETWFAASAESLIAAGYVDPQAEVSEVPEQQRLRKGWIKRHIQGTYSETADQARLSAAINPALARSRCPSFDKLCRELERRALPPSSP